MHSFTCTTQSGTKYKVSFTETQNIVVIWNDPKGDPNCKGSAVKVWEDCQIRGLSADPEIGMWHASLKVLALGLQIEGTDRYNRRPVSWATTKLVSIVRDDGKVLL